MTPYYDEDGITIYHGDCFDILHDLSGIGAVVTDPPIDPSSLGTIGTSGPSSPGQRCGSMLRGKRPTLARSSARSSTGGNSRS
jgi:hypothetical protein